MDIPQLERPIGGAGLGGGLSRARLTAAIAGIAHRIIAVGLALAALHVIGGRRLSTGARGRGPA